MFQDGRYFGIHLNMKGILPIGLKSLGSLRRLQVFEKIFSWVILWKNTIKFSVVELFEDIIEMLLF